MKTISATLICACIALAAGGVSAQDTMQKHDGMAKDGMMNKNMTMQECKDHIAMSGKEGMKQDVPKKDAAMMKQEAYCAAMMKKEGTPGEPMKK